MNRKSMESQATMLRRRIAKREQMIRRMRELWFPEFEDLNDEDLYRLLRDNDFWFAIEVGNYLASIHSLEDELYRLERQLEFVFLTPNQKIKHMAQEARELRYELLEGCE